MPDIPKDPRQLARDILSGKISIEDLAREQAKRRQGGGNVPAASMPVPPIPPRETGANKDRMPEAVRVPQRAPTPVRRPPKVVVRKQPPVRPQPQPPQPAPQQRPQPPVPATPNAYAIAQPNTPDKSATKGPGPTAPAAPAPVLRTILGSHNALRHAIIAAEVLGKPLSLRDEAF